MGFEIDVTPKFLEGKIFFPPKVLKRLEDLRVKFAHTNEYAMFLHAEVDMDNLEIWVDEDIYDIPNQKVGPATVEIEDSTFEIDPETGYGKKPLDRTLNCVVHRHPNGVDSFSSTDNEYINVMNPISFLYQEGYYVPKARINVPWGDKILPLYVTPYLIYSDGEKEEYLELDVRRSTYYYGNSVYNGVRYGSGSWSNYEYGFYDYETQEYVARRTWDKDLGQMVDNPDFEERLAAHKARLAEAEKNRPLTPTEKIKAACDAAEEDLDLELCKERIKTYTYEYFKGRGMVDVEDLEDIQGFMDRRRKRGKKHKGKKGKKVPYELRGQHGSSANFNHVFVGGESKQTPKPALTKPASLVDAERKGSVIEFHSGKDDVLTGEELELEEERTLGVDEEMDQVDQDAYYRMIYGEDY